jgi:hypothetical protein
MPAITSSYQDPKQVIKNITQNKNYWYIPIERIGVLISLHIYNISCAVNPCIHMCIDSGFRRESKRFIIRKCRSIMNLSWLRPYQCMSPHVTAESLAEGNQIDVRWMSNQFLTRRQHASHYIIIVAYLQYQLCCQSVYSYVYRFRIQKGIKAIHN